MDMNIHGVKRIEVCRSWPANGNSRTLRIVTENWKGEEHETEITLYGDTDVLDAIQTSADFKCKTAEDKARVMAAVS